MAKKRRTSQPVRQPLEPTIMTELGALTAAPPPVGDFDPAGEWTASYRIWTCYGHRGRANRNHGVLRIARKPGGATQRLRIEQTVRNSQGKLHTVRAELRCRIDAIASPTDWTVTSRFRGARMAGLPETALQQSGRIRGSTWQIAVGAETSSRKIDGPLTADWCLFEAVQRLAPRAGQPLAFDVLEGLTALKTDHRLRYRDKRRARWGPQELSLHCFAQVGRGVYPYEYWLDDRRRLLLVTTGPRTYILDPQAEKTFRPGTGKRPRSARAAKQAKGADR